MMTLAHEAWAAEADTPTHVRPAFGSLHMTHVSGSATQANVDVVKALFVAEKQTEGASLYHIKLFISGAWEPVFVSDYFPCVDRNGLMPAFSQGVIREEAFCYCWRKHTPK